MLLDIWCEKRWGLLISAVSGAICTAAAVLLFSAVSCFLLDSMVFLRIMSLVSLVAGGLVGGYSCGKLRRRRGLAEGSAVGGMMYIMLLAVSLCISGHIPGIMKLVILALSGGAGGVSGVNSKRLSHVYCSGQRKAAGQSRENPAYKRQHRRNY